MRPLGGGIAQASDALTIDDRMGHRHRLVLQRWIRPGWETDDPGFDPAKDAAVLAAFAASPVPVPRVVAVDVDGAAAGVAALLTTRLPGRPPSAALVQRPATIEALGASLAAIHRFAVAAGLAADVELRRLVPPYAPFGSLAAARIPAATSRPDAWRAALDLAAAAPPDPPTPPILIHRDVHPGSTLWLDGRLSGVVDWTSASWGSPAADLAHLRVNLVVDVSAAAADGARAAFARAGGDLTGARHHDLRTLFDFLSDVAPAHLTPAVVARLDAWLAGLVAAGPERDQDVGPGPSVSEGTT